MTPRVKAFILILPATPAGVLYQPAVHRLFRHHGRAASSISARPTAEPHLHSSVRRSGRRSPAGDQPSHPGAGERQAANIQAATELAMLLTVPVALPWSPPGRSRPSVPGAAGSPRRTAISALSTVDRLSPGAYVMINQGSGARLLRPGRHMDTILDAVASFGGGSAPISFWSPSWGSQRSLRPPPGQRGSMPSAFMSSPSPRISRFEG